MAVLSVTAPALVQGQRGADAANGARLSPTDHTGGTLESPRRRAESLADRASKRRCNQPRSLPRRRPFTCRGFGAAFGMFSTVPSSRSRGPSSRAPGSRRIVAGLFPITCSAILLRVFVWRSLAVASATSEAALGSVASRRYRSTGSPSLLRRSLLVTSLEQSWLEGRGGDSNTMIAPNTTDGRIRMGSQAVRLESTEFPGIPAGRSPQPPISWSQTEG